MATNVGSLPAVVTVQQNELIALYFLSDYGKIQTCLTSYNLELV